MAIVVKNYVTNILYIYIYWNDMMYWLIWCIDWLIAVEWVCEPIVVPTTHTQNKGNMSLTQTCRQKYQPCIPTRCWQFWIYHVSVAVIPVRYGTRLVRRVLRRMEWLRTTPEYDLLNEKITFDDFRSFLVNKQLSQKPLIIIVIIMKKRFSNQKKGNRC